MFAKAPTGSAYYKNLRAEFFEIAPDAAARVLERSQGKNFRKLRDAYSSIIARDIEDERWMDDGSTVCFWHEESIRNAKEAIERGILIDGQHRLDAIVKSGKPLVLLVVIGVENVEAKDSGRGRSIADKVQHENIGPNAALISCVARYAYNWQKGLRGASISSAGVSHMEILEFAKGDQDIAESACEAKRIVDTSRNIMKPSITGLLIFLSRKHGKANEMTDYLTKIATGVGLEPTAPALKAREMLLQAKMGKTVPKPGVELARMLIGWEYHLRGKKCHFIRWTTDGDRPMPFPEFAK